MVRVRAGRGLHGGQLLVHGAAGLAQWAPRFDYMLEQQACNYLDANKGINSAMYATLLGSLQYGLGERERARDRERERERESNTA